MKGLLEFTLGLTTSGFLSNLGGADARIKGFIGSMIGAGAIVAGFQKAIEKGAGLKQLSDITTTSIGNLYRIQQGLKEVGASGDSAGSLLVNLNKSLGGINDNGEPTAAVFSQIGLSIGDLKKLNAPQQLLSIAAALNKLDVESATSSAGKIFGRYNATEFLKLSYNADEFADALRRGGAQAEIYDRFGRTFEKIESLTSILKERFSGIFVGLAAGTGPSLERVLKSLNQIDFSKIGAGIGTALSGFIEAFREGKLSDLIGDSLKLGFDSILAFAPGIFIKVGAALIKAFETPLIFIQAGMEYALQQGANFALSGLINNKVFRTIFAFDPLFHDVLNQASQLAGNSSFQEIYNQRKAEGLKFNFGSGEFDTEQMNNVGNAYIAAGKQKIKDEADAWLAKIQTLANQAPPPDAPPPPPGGGKDILGAIYTPERTALEKMGFVFRGGAGSDPQTQIARNTARTANTLEGIAANQQKAISKGGTFGLQYNF